MEGELCYTVEVQPWLNSRCDFLLSTTPPHIASNRFKQEAHCCRGQKLWTVRYEPRHPKAAVYFHHGYSEYLFWYKRLFTMLAERGFCVYGFDAHGHGHSEPKDTPRRVYVEDLQHCVDDALGFLRDVVQPRCESHTCLEMGDHRRGPSGLIS